MAVAHTVNAVQSPHDDASTGRLAAADALARALTLDMANWWQPTAANYFARIKKDQILQAIQEATGAPVKERLRSLKKQDLTAEAEKSVTGTRWLPELLRKLSIRKRRVRPGTRPFPFPDFQHRLHHLATYTPSGV